MKNLGKSDFILVPIPAARTIAARVRGHRTENPFNFKCQRAKQLLLRQPARLPDLATNKAGGRQRRLKPAPLREKNYFFSLFGSLERYFATSVFNRRVV